MEPTSRSNSAKIFDFPSGGRGAATAQQAEDHLKAMGAEKLPAGTGWYHDAAMKEAEQERQPRELPWWAEAEGESRAKGTLRRLY
jgi:hypothetical protein